MAAEYRYFYEDEIYRINKRGDLEFGMVLENAEFVSSDDGSDVDEEDRMKKGHIRVAWHPRGEEEVLQERKVGLADRSLMPGDVVRRLIKGRDTQRGYCRNVQVTASVQVVGTKQVIYSVKSSDLTPLEDFSTDIVVCLNSWVGMVKMVKSKVHMYFADGSHCVLDDHEAADLDDLRDRRDRVRMDSEFRRYDFYPAQMLCGPMRCFESAEWTICTKDVNSLRNKPNKNVRVTVKDVKIWTLGIHWQCRAYSKEDGVGSDKEQPKYLIQGEDLKKVKMLNIFEPCTLQIGDRNYYVFKENDILLTKDQWKKLEKDVLYGAKGENGPARPRPSPKRLIDKFAEEAANHGDGEDSSDQYEDIETDDGSLSDTGSISSGCSSGSQGSRRIKKGPALMTKMLKKRKLKRAKKQILPDAVVVKAGDRVVVETLTTSSKADVVWQDGTFEHDIPSTQLYPIHHLDDQEFFPGDFVIENKDDPHPHIYGVVQKVDHAGRTATVWWSQTYTTGNEPHPQFLYESEVSVYDLKDHPDFKYRPGSVVIRVANFEGENVACTAGQVLDNYPSGQVQVWWVSGHVSMCWPQDLYKVGEYDSDEGELWDDGDSDTSWETQSEHSIPIDDSFPEEDMNKLLKPKLAANIEKARIAMARLEEIFTQNPALQTTSVMRQLLEVYKDCRYLDRLMGTSFFHESHFQGLLERVKERGRINTAQKVAEQVTRLFQSTSELEVDRATASENNCDKSGFSNDSGVSLNRNGESFSGSDVLSENLANLELKLTAECSSKFQNYQLEDVLQELHPAKETVVAGNQVTSTPRSDLNKKTEALKQKRMHESEITIQENSSLKDSRLRDSRSCDELKCCDNRLHEDARTSHVCAKLCSLIKGQLVKAHEEVMQRFGGQASFSEADLEDSVEEEPEVTEGAQGGEGRREGWEKSEAPVSEEKENKKDEEDKMNTGVVMSGELRKGMLEIENAAAAATVPRPAPPIQPAGEGFQILDTAPSNHKFKLTMFQPTDPKTFFKAVRKEMKLLRTSLPEGITVKTFDDRMDLYSVMIKGPEKTPYEDGFFFFDFQLSADYPKAPPVCHYISYCSDRLNPNLYEDGKVCISLLGTWSGKGTEMWTSNSNLLQILVSIQGLILVSEPYFNEAGYERQKGTQQGRENSRMYNEMVVLKLVQSMTKLILHPPEIFKTEILAHFQKHAYKLIQRLQKWLEISERYNSSHPLSPTTPTTFRELHGDVVSSLANIQLPEFPLIPASKGFCITLQKTIGTFQDVLQSVGIVDDKS